MVRKATACDRLEPSIQPINHAIFAEIVMKSSQIRALVGELIFVSRIPRYTRVNRRLREEFLQASSAFPARCCDDARNGKNSQIGNLATKEQFPISVILVSWTRIQQKLSNALSKVGVGVNSRVPFALQLTNEIGDSALTAGRGYGFKIRWFKKTVDVAHLIHGRFCQAGSNGRSL